MAIGQVIKYIFSEIIYNQFIHGILHSNLTGESIVELFSYCSLSQNRWRPVSSFIENIQVLCVNLISFGIAFMLNSMNFLSLMSNLHKLLCISASH